MFSNKTFGFIGLGLIGGSIAKALKRLYPDCKIIACARSRETVAYALEKKIIDHAADSVNSDFSACDYIFLCAPVAYNNTYMELLKPLLKPDCILTDVGSVKTGIYREAQRLGMTGQFIGGHPMAGSEKTGIQSATDRLLENAYFVLAPTEDTNPDKLEEYRKLVESIGAIPLILDCEKHDYITAAISHLPHIIASGLVNLVKDSDDKQGHMKQIAAGGFKDITRIASSSSGMWQQICLSNSENIEQILDDYIRSMQQAKKALHEKNEDDIYNLFEKAREYRDSIPNSSLGPIKKIYSIYCDIIDEAGAIATIATILSTNMISIKNIGIVHNREFEEGVLRIEFYGEEPSKKAVDLLRKYSYTVYEKK